MFYDNYIRLCNSIGKAPSAVAIEIGISKPTVNRWKNGGSPTDATLQKIADYFGVPASDLLGKDKQKKPAPKKDELGYSDMELLDAYERADEATKKAIRLLLKVE